jgi:phosphatidylglycerophosphatase A
MFGIKKLFLTVFGSGYSPILPGTCGSLASLPIIFLIAAALPANPALRLFVVLAIFAVVFTLAGLLIQENAVKECKLPNANECIDHHWIVIDEFLGLYIALLPLFFSKGFDWRFILLAFVLFRFFDMTKVLGVSAIDKRNDWASILMDDMLAGMYAFVIVAAIFAWLR